MYWEKKTKTDKWGNRERWYLVAVDEVESVISLFRVAQERARWFKNIRVEEYHGSKYKPEKVRWVVEG